jgi:hypothetical protein
MEGVQQRINKRYNSIDLLEKSEIKIDIINSKKENLKFLNKKSLRNENNIEKMSQEDFDFNLLKFNLSSQTNTVHNKNLSRENENFLINNFFQNESTSFYKEFSPDGAKRENKEFENNFLKKFLFSKVEKVLTSDNLREKLHLYYILCSSDLSLVKEKTEKLFTDQNTRVGYTQDLMQQIEGKLQKEIFKRTIWNFCKFLDYSGYSIVPGESLGRQDEQDYVHYEDKEPPAPVPPKQKKLKKEKKKKQSEDMKKAWLCPHIYRIHYARGKCQNCYLNFYHKVIQKIVN